MNELEFRMIRTRGLSFEVACAGEGDQLVLLLHGFPESAHCWRHQIPALAAAGYRVWAPNLRGYGNTDRPRGVAAYTQAALESDVADLIEASGAKHVTLIGHDFGGAIAWSYAMHGARPLDRLVILNCPHPVPFKRALLTPRQLARSWYMLLFQLPIVPEWLVGLDHARVVKHAILDSAVHRERFPREVIDHYRALASQPGALTAMIHYYRAMGRMIAFGPRRRGHNITKPTLIVWGERDVVLGTELLEGTERYVDDLTVTLIPDASHWVQQDTPEAVNAILTDWLAKH